MNLKRSFDGAVYLPGDEGYDTHRRALRPDLDPRPTVVVEAWGAADVRNAVLAAQAHDLPFAVQGTGHGTHVAADGALLLKTSAMATVLVDPDRRVARVGAGARWGQVLAAAAPFGLAPLSGSSKDVGVAGYTLGGGFGWLGRKFGFAADSLVRAEVVTADGRIVTASADQYPDLFWALRGGGGNFGAVTSLEFKLYPVAQVFAGSAYFPIERASNTLMRYREWAATAPDEVSTAVLLRTMPDTPDVPAPVRGKRALVIKAMYAGDAASARRVLTPLWKAAGKPLAGDYAAMSYVDAAMGGTAARYFDMFRELPDRVIETLVAAHDDNGSTVEVRHWGGAIANPGRNAGPVGHRDVPFSVILDAPTTTATDGLLPYAEGASFLNFLGDTSRTPSAYTLENYRRLSEVKRFYDPQNVFGMTHNISPTPAILRRLATVAA